MENVEFKQSRIAGKGLFAKKAYKKGELVYSYSPEKIVSLHDIHKLSVEEQLHLNKIGENKYELLGAPACYVNHSCNPNIEEKDRKGYAVREILEGEELTVDYDRDGYFEIPFTCNCSSNNCRGVIRGKK